MTRITVAVQGLGNVGRQALLALEAAPDMRCIGILRGRHGVAASMPGNSHGGADFYRDTRGVPVFHDRESLAAGINGLPDVVILCGPSREVGKQAAGHLAAGCHTVDCFDIHSEIPAQVERLDRAARDAGRVAVTAAGWDPGTDSLLRALLEAMAPAGETFTNFGPGRSMGHSVAAGGVAGVAGAVSITLPLGKGKHSRLVHVLPEEGADLAAIRETIAADPYFSSEPLEVRFLQNRAELEAVTDNSHGVLMERSGGLEESGGQRFNFDMRIDNPALTAQIMVAAARAAARGDMRLSPGCYTMIDIPPVAFLPGARMDNIARLV